MNANGDPVSAAELGPSTNGDSLESSSDATTAGAVVGGVLGAALLVAAMILLMRHRNNAGTYARNRRGQKVELAMADKDSVAMQANPLYEANTEPTLPTTTLHTAPAAPSVGFSDVSMYANPQYSAAPTRAAATVGHYAAPQYGIAASVLSSSPAVGGTAAAAAAATSDGGPSGTELRTQRESNVLLDENSTFPAPGPRLDSFYDRLSSSSGSAAANDGVNLYNSLRGRDDAVKGIYSIPAYKADDSLV